MRCCVGGMHHAQDMENIPFSFLLGLTRDHVPDQGRDHEEDAEELAHRRDLGPEAGAGEAEEAKIGATADHVAEVKVPEKVRRHRIADGCPTSVINIITAASSPLMGSYIFLSKEFCRKG